MRQHRSGLAAMLLVLALGAVAGCDDPETVCGDDGVGAITFATVKDLSVKQRAELADMWREKHPDEPLDIVVLPATSDEQRAQLAATLQIGERSGGGQHDGYDVVGLDVIALPEFAKGEYLQRLDPGQFSADRFLRVPWESSFYHDKLYAVPFTTNVGLLYYWADELVRMGVLTDKSQQWRPGDWRNVARVARDSLTSPKPGRPTGYTGQLAQYEGLTANTMEMIWAAGGDLPTPTEKVDAATLDRAATGLGFLLDGVRNRWIDKSALGFDERSSLNAFQQRKALVMRHWPDALPTLAATSGDIRVTALPGSHAAVLGGESVAVARCSPNRATAMSFLKFLTDVPQQLWIFKNGLYLPAVESPYEDGTLVNTEPYHLSRDVVDLLHSSINQARARPAEPAYNHASDLIQTQVHQALERSADDEVNARAVVATLADDLRR